MYDVRFPEVYLIFRLISIKAAGWRSWLADRRYRGTRCLFANAHRALMNLWTRQEAHRIEIRPDTSYFFLSPLSFFLSPLLSTLLPLLSPGLRRDDSTDISTNVETGGPISSERLETSLPFVFFDLRYFQYRFRELIFIELLENLFRINWLNWINYEARFIAGDGGANWFV